MIPAAYSSAWPYAIDLGVALGVEAGGLLIMHSSPATVGALLRGAQLDQFTRPLHPPRRLLWFPTDPLRLRLPGTTQMGWPDLGS